MIAVRNLYTYPIKSTHSIEVKESQVTNLGLRFDREWGIFDMENKCLTAREYPQLLDIKYSVQPDHLSLKYEEDEIGILEFDVNSSNSIDLKVHSYDGYGLRVSENLDNWFSNFLNINCRLMRVDHRRLRPVLERHGGISGDTVGFADQAAILITSHASLEDLNARLDYKIGMDRFRPNIVVDGCAPYEEDQWKIVQIGNCKFRIIHHCERCVLTTIDPITKQKSSLGEPLVTLSKYRKVNGGGVIFGVRAVPLDEGKIRIEDQLRFIQ